jgi:hypothetical protein
MLGLLTPGVYCALLVVNGAGCPRHRTAGAGMEVHVVTDLISRKRFLRPLLALSLFLAWGAIQSTQADAGPPAQSAELSIRIDGPGGPRCSTQPGDSTLCRVPVGEQFEVGVNLDDFMLQDFDMDTLAGYVGIEPELGWSSGLTLKPRPALDYVTWPDCGIAGTLAEPGYALLACVTGIGQPSSQYLGRIAEVELTCAPSVSTGHSATMLHAGAPGSAFDIFDENATGVGDDDPPEVLTIDCLFIWDVNGDAVVSGGDIGIVVSQYGQMVPPAPAVVDLDGGGVVAAGDIGQVVSHYGEMAPP